MSSHHHARGHGRRRRKFLLVVAIVILVLGVASVFIFSEISKVNTAPVGGNPNP